MSVMNPDDLFKIKWLMGGKLSPDSKSVVYVVSHIKENVKGKDGKAEDKEYTTLYLHNLETGDTRKLTSGKNEDGSPEWSPDGKTIAFVSDRNEKPQIYLLPVDGGEAQQLTNLKQGASNPTWSPDGKQIAFTAGIDWGDNKPDRNKDPYRVTRSVWRFNVIEDLDLAVTNIYVVEVASGEVKQLTDSPTVDGYLRWSPDGSRILFTALMNPDSIASVFGDMCTVDMDGNVQQLITGWEITESGFWHGDRIVFVGNPNDVTIGTNDNLWVYDTKTGEFDNRTPSLELQVNGSLLGRTPNATLTPLYVGFSDNHAYVRVQEAGTVQIYRIALDGGEDCASVVSGDRNCMLLDVGQGKLLYSVDDIHNPRNLYICNEDGSDERCLTQLNDEFMSDFPQPEVLNFHVKSTDGADVEGWYVKPTNGAQAPYPTILWIHGGPHYAQGHTFAFDTHMLNGAGYGVLFVNHRASTGYGNAFSTAIKGDWGNLDYGDLMAGVDYAIEQGLADADKLGVSGVSGGGNLSCWIVGNTNQFKAAIPENPLTNWNSFYGVSDIGVWFGLRELGGHPHEIPDIYSKCSPITYAHNCTTPTLLIQGEHDWRCPPEQAEQFYTVLKANNCVTEMLRLPGGSHQGSRYGALPLRKAYVKAKLAWFNQYILCIEPEEDDSTED